MFTVIEGDAGLANSKLRPITRYLGDVMGYARIPQARIYLLTGKSNEAAMLNTQ